MSSPDKNEPSTITGSRFVGGNITCNAVQYDRQKYDGLFCKTRPPVSFVMSKFQKQNLVKVPFTLQANKKQGVLRWFLMWRWLYRLDFRRSLVSDLPSPRRVRGRSAGSFPEQRLVIESIGCTTHTKQQLTDM